MSRTWIALSTCIVVAACGADDPGPVAGEEYADMPSDQVMFDVEHFITTDGARRARVEADTAFVYEQTGQIEMRQVHLVVFDDQGRERAVLTANAGTMKSGSQKMEAEGDVVLVTTEGGRRITTERLNYDPSLDRIWSDAPTTMVEDGTTVEGEGFTADAQLRNVEVQRPTGEFEGLELEF